MAAGLDNLGNVVPSPTVDNQRLKAGKYKTEEELESGYLHQQAETAKIIAQRDEYERKAQIMEAMIRGGDSDRVMPADRVAARSGNAMDSLMEQINSGSVDRATLENALGEAAAQQLQPVTAVMAARQRVGVDFPDFGQFEPEVNQFLNANPEIDQEYREMVVNPRTAAAAMRYARLMYDRARAGGKAPTELVPVVDTSGAAQAAARLDAALPGAGGANRATALEQQADADRAALLARGRQTGDWTGYLTATLGNLSEGH